LRELSGVPGTARARLRVDAHKRQGPIVDPEAIEQARRAYQSPPHFRDYETYTPAIPAFGTYSPALLKDRRGGRRTAFLSSGTKSALRIYGSACVQVGDSPLSACHEIIRVPGSGTVAFVSHTIREKTKLLNRVRRLRGQVEAVERALKQEIGCADVLQLIAGARGAMDGQMGEVIEDHIRMHVIDPALQPDSAAGRATEELIDVVRSYLS
jgi:FrmR/RcnR family transcriptional regulator, repressor of frmRAB operon